MKRKKKTKVPTSIFDHENWGGEHVWGFTKNKTVNDLIMKWLLLLIVIALVVVSFDVVVKRIVNNKCETLKNYSEQEYDFFFVTHQQKIDCDEAGFTFAGTRNAPVHTNTIPREEGETYIKQGIWYMNEAGMFHVEINNEVTTD